MTRIKKFSQIIAVVLAAVVMFMISDSANVQFSEEESRVLIAEEAAMYKSEEATEEILKEEPVEEEAIDMLITIIEDVEMPLVASPADKAHFIYMLKQMKTAEPNDSGKVRIRFQNEVVASSNDFWMDFKKMEALYQPYFQRFNSSYTAYRSRQSTVVTSVQFDKAVRSAEAGMTLGKKADAKINAIVKGAKKKKGVKNRIKYVDQQICKACVYDNTKNRQNCRNPYGALVEKKAVCQGYSEAFYACMTRLGIPCDLVQNRSGSHMWTKVKVKGKWYHIDTCWNDSGKKSNRKYYLMSASKTRKIRDHQF